MVFNDLILLKTFFLQKYTIHALIMKIKFNSTFMMFLSSTLKDKQLK